MTDVPPPLTGDRVGPYTLGSSLGLGGIAAVYEGTDDQGREAAVKVLHPGKLDTDEVQRFVREYQALQELDHPNIVKVLEWGRHGPYPWFAMELVRGTDLERLVESWEGDPPPDRWDRVERYTRQLCDALAYLHEQGLIHRDLKPSNVLISQQDQVKLGDFGGVKGRGNLGADLTAVGRLVGTVAFMAPELISGEDVDSRQDLYSLGAVLYVMLTGRPPVEAETIAGYLAQHLSSTPVPPTELDPRVPGRLERVCLDLLTKDPARRPATARRVLRLLDGEVGEDRFPLRGRDDLVARVLAGLDRAGPGGGGVYVLTGSEGSGRSALLQELVSRLRERGVGVLTASGTVPRPDLVTHLLAQLPADRPASPGGGARQELSARLAGRRVVIAIDDADALEPSARDALVAVLRERIAVHGDPLVFLAVSRESGLGRCGHLSGRDTGIRPQRLSVPPLDAPALVAMLRDRGVVAAAAAVLGRRLCRDLDGHPGAVLEQLEALSRAGWLTPGPDGHLRAARPLGALRGERLPVPVRIRERDLARLQALPAAHRPLVELLAVFEREASLRMIALALQFQGAGDAGDALPEPGDGGRASSVLASGAGEERLARDLDRLVEAEALVRTEDGVQEAYAVAGTVFREVVYSEIPADRRAKMHRAVAHALRRLYRRRRDGADEIAEHLLRGGDTAEAWPLLVGAARHHERAGRLRPAARAVERALVVRGAAEARIRAEPDGGPVRAARLAGELLGVRGRLLLAEDAASEAMEAFGAAVAAAREAGVPALLAEALEGLGQARQRQGDLQEASEALQQALESLDPAGEAWRRCAHRLARVHLINERLSEAVVLWRESVHAARVAGDRASEGRALAGLALAELGNGEDIVAMATLERAEQVLRETGERLTLLRLLCNLSELAMARGRYPEAEDRAGEAVRIASTLEESQLLALARAQRAAAAHALGRETTARALAREALTLARAVLPGAGEPEGARGERFRQARGRVAWGQLATLARVLVGLGEHEEVCTAFPPPRDSDRRYLEDQAALLGAVRARALAVSDPEGARELAGWALRRPPSALTPSAAQVEIDAARALLQAGDPEGAGKALRRARLRLNELPYDGLHLDIALLRHQLRPGPPTARDLDRRLCAVLRLHTEQHRRSLEQRPDLKAYLRVREGSERG